MKFNPERDNTNWQSHRNIVLEITGSLAAGMAERKKKLLNRNVFSDEELEIPVSIMFQPLIHVIKELFA